MKLNKKGDLNFLWLVSHLYSVYTYKKVQEGTRRQSGVFSIRDDKNGESRDFLC